MQAAALGFQNVLGVLVLCPAVILHQAVFPADGGQALVSVVLPQGQAVLAPAGHHPVGSMTPLVTRSSTSVPR